MPAPHLGVSTEYSKSSRPTAKNLSHWKNPCLQTLKRWGKTSANLHEDYDLGSLTNRLLAETSSFTRRQSCTRTCLIRRKILNMGILKKFLTYELILTCFTSGALSRHACRLYISMQATVIPFGLAPGWFCITVFILIGFMYTIYWIMKKWASWQKKAGSWLKVFEERRRTLERGYQNDVILEEGI
jgi:hypothetical protein